MYKIIYLKEVVVELSNAIKWYNNQQTGLGKKLIAEIENNIQNIKTNPFSASIKYNNIRTLALNKFPFTIHYSIDESNQKIIIIAIFHNSRNPFWKE